MNMNPVFHTDNVDLAVTFRLREFFVTVDDFDGRHMVQVFVENRQDLDLLVRFWNNNSSDMFNALVVG